MTIEQAKSISLPDFLNALGFTHTRRNGRRLIYLSPLRKDNSPSFVVDANSNKWCDFGTGERGDIIDFVRIYAHVSDVSSALVWLGTNMKGEYAHVPTMANDTQPHPIKKPVIHKAYPLTNQRLLEYLFNRGIPGQVSMRYCKEIWRPNPNPKKCPLFWVAFPSRGGYEARNKYQKRCFGTKDISTIFINKDVCTKECCVFEGFIDFLSYVVFFRSQHAVAQKELCDCFVLNSVVNVSKVLPELSKYSKIHCYLDNDERGNQATKEIMAAYPRATIDESSRYQPENDLNDFLTQLLNLRNKKKE